MAPRSSSLASLRVDPFLEIEARQDEVLARLDELNARLEALLAESQHALRLHPAGRAAPAVGPRGRASSAASS